MIETSTFRSEKNILEKWIHRWGCSASEAILDADCSIFRAPDINGFIGYHQTLGCAIVYGDPICAAEDTYRLAEAFHAYCREKNLNIIYMIASKSFAHWAIQHLCKVMIEVGEELIFDPKFDPTKGHSGYRIRNKLNHIEHLGLECHEYLSEDASIEKAIQEVGQSWQSSRKGPQIYLGHLDFFKNRENRRWFYIKNKEKIVATALLSRLDASKGWLLKFLITTPRSPRGTSEALMMYIIKTLSQENCPFITLGMVPADHLGEVVGLNKFMTWFAGAFFKIAKWFFRLNRRKEYWLKFRPISQPAYILFSHHQVSVNEIRALMQALKIEIK